MSEWFDYGRDQLADMLAGLYQTETDIRTVLATAGIPAEMVTFDGKAFNVWFDAIGIATNLNRLGNLIDVIAKRYENKEADLRLLYSRYMFFVAWEAGEYVCANQKRTRSRTRIARSCLAGSGAFSCLDRRQPEVESARIPQPVTRYAATSRAN